MENKFKGRALNQNIIVLEIANEIKTASGFDITGMVIANEVQKKGIIVSVGDQVPKLSDGKSIYSVGEVVIFNKTRENPFTQDGIRYLIIDYRECIWTP